MILYITTPAFGHPFYNRRGISPPRHCGAVARNITQTRVLTRLRYNLWECQRRAGIFQYFKQGGCLHYVESYNILSSKDGLAFAVTTQWNKDNIRNIVEFALSQGWNVREKK